MSVVMPSLTTTLFIFCYCLGGVAADAHQGYRDFWQNSWVRQYMDNRGNPICNTANIGSEIQSTRNYYRNLFQSSGNINVLTEMFTPDAMLMISGDKTARAKDAIRLIESQRYSRGIVKEEFFGERYNCFGTYAVEVGRVLLKDSSDHAVETARGLAVWVRDSSGWKIQYAMQITDVNLNPIDKLFALYPESQDDGIFFGWSHASNMRDQVVGAFTDSGIQLLESDVRIVDGTPVMQHDASKPFDLTLMDYINLVMTYPARRRGIKLDFKDLGSVQQALPFVQNMAGIDKLPMLMLNADIAPGPGPSDQVPNVDGATFVSLAKQYLPKSPLSVGWMVQTLLPNDTRAKYTMDMVQTMHSFTKDLDVPITFPLRGSYVRNSMAELKWLLDQKPTYTFTMWHKGVDAFNDDYVNGLREMRSSVARDRIFYDLPPELITRIKA